MIANQNKAIFTLEIICLTKVNAMKEIREKISSIDDKVLKLLAERRQLSIEIIKFKNEEKSSIRDKEREKQLLERERLQLEKEKMQLQTAAELLKLKQDYNWLMLN